MGSLVPYTDSRMDLIRVRSKKWCWRKTLARIGPNGDARVNQIAVAREAVRDGAWLARWLWARDIEAQVIHPNSIAVSREHSPGRNRPAR
jgi:hypothetical protein